MSKDTNIKPNYDQDLLWALIRKYGIRPSFARMAIRGERTSERAIALKEEYDAALKLISANKKKVISEIIN